MHTKYKLIEGASGGIFSMMKTPMSKMLRITQTVKKMQNVHMVKICNDGRSKTLETMSFKYSK